MKCPKCDNLEMNEETVGEIVVDRCPGCHGIWFDLLELERVLESDPRALLDEDRAFQAHPGEPGPRIQCPRCQGTYLIKLNSRLRPGTILDSCKVCYGVWLDAGELTRLAHADFLGGLRMIFGG